MKTILDYLKQPSTWKGLIFLATVAGVNLAPDQWEMITSAGMTIVGLILTFQNDSTKKK